jgi:hypothetical protein
VIKVVGANSLFIYDVLSKLTGLSETANCEKVAIFEMLLLLGTQT